MIMTWGSIFYNDSSLRINSILKKFKYKNRIKNDSDVRSPEDLRQVT